MVPPMLNKIYLLLQTIHANQRLMIGLLRSMLRDEENMALDLTKLQAEITNNTTVTGSVVTLVQKLAAEIAAIPPSTDPTTQAALDALTATLTANDGTIAAAVTANTSTATGS